MTPTTYVSAASIGTDVVLALLFWLLYARDRRRYLSQWALGWTIGTVWVGCVTVASFFGALAPETYGALGGIGLLAVIYFLFGTGSFLGRHISRAWWWVSVVSILLAAALQFTDVPEPILRAPLGLLVIAANVRIGVAWMSPWRDAGALRIMIGVLFLAWAASIQLFVVSGQSGMAMALLLAFSVTLRVGLGLAFHVMHVERLRDETQELQEEVTRAQRVEATNRLVGGVAHDFNSLLTVILNNAELLSREKGLSDQSAADLTSLRVAAEHAASLTKQLLVLGRSEPLRCTPTELKRIVLGLEKIIHSIFERQQGVDICFELDECRVLADPVHLERVILNLVINARDAMAAGGVLTIRTGYTAAPELSAAPDGYACIEVSDTGVGFDEQTRAHLFEPFFTTKREGEGTGLGLAIAYTVATQCGGRITADGAPGQGATFRVILPATEQPSLEVIRFDVSDFAGRGKAVLLAEDNALLRETTRTVLEMNGCVVMTAENGEAALALGTANLPDVLVSDVVMPKMNGLELARRLRAQDNGLPVVLVSGYADRTFEEHGELPEHIFLEKPFTPERLLAAVTAALDRDSGKNLSRP